jgi:ATP-binding cassette subfamily B protein
MSWGLFNFGQKKAKNKNKSYELMYGVQVDRFTFRQYIAAMLQFRAATLVILIGFSFATICFGVVIPFLLAHAVDLISRKQQIAYGTELFTTLLLAVVSVVLATISNGIGLRGFARLDGRAQNFLRASVFDRLMSESSAFYSNTKAGSLMGHVMAYINGYAIIQEIVFQRGLNLVLPLLIGILVIAWQSPLLASMLLLISFSIGVKTLVDSRRRAPYRKVRKEAMTRLNGFLGDVITNSAIVRTFAAQDQERQRLMDNQQKWQAASQANLWIFGTHYRNLTGGVHALQIISIGMAAWLASTGHISLGLVVFTISYFQRLSSGLLDLAPIVQGFQGALMDAAPISELLLSPRTILDKPGAKKLVIKKGAIKVQNVTHRYEETAPIVFKGLNLQIPAGQSVGLVGHSGSGKTTLTNLLLRFVDSNDGTIVIDNQNIKDVTQQSLRRAISYVPQDSQLFHRSIFENIAYGNPHATEKAIIVAAKRAHIWDFIQSLPQGLQTEVGERGLKLSGGQRQRIAIARAILKDAPILIFDEATSALDSESEKHIQASIAELIKNRTSIIIAHRLSTIQKLDRIIVIDKGNIIQDGTHEILAKQKGLYATFWSHQSGGFISDKSSVIE